MTFFSLVGSRSSHTPSLDLFLNYSVKNYKKPISLFSRGFHSGLIEHTALTMMLILTEAKSWGWVAEVLGWNVFAGFLLYLHLIIPSVCSGYICGLCLCYSVTVYLCHRLKPSHLVKCSRLWLCCPHIWVGVSSGKKGPHMAFHPAIRLYSNKLNRSVHWLNCWKSHPSLMGIMGSTLSGMVKFRTCTRAILSTWFVYFPLHVAIHCSGCYLRPSGSSPSNVPRTTQLDGCLLVFF